LTDYIVPLVAIQPLFKVEFESSLYWGNSWSSLSQDDIDDTIDQWQVRL